MMNEEKIIEGTPSNSDTKILLKALADRKLTDTGYLQRVNQHKFIEVDVANTTDILTDMRLTFLDNSNNYHELGQVIPSLSLTDGLTLSNIEIQFDDLILLSRNIENGNFTYQIKSHMSSTEDASSVRVLNIDHDVVVSVSLEDNFLKLVAVYGYVDTELDINNVVMTQVFIVNYQEFMEYVAVVENCLISEAIIQNQLKDNLSLLSAVMKKNIPDLLSTYTRDVSYYIESISKLLPTSNEIFGQDLMNIVCNRSKFISPAINTHIVFFNEKFAANDYEVFQISIEQLHDVGSRLLEGSSVSVNANNSTLANFSIVENQVVIKVDFYKENTIGRLGYRHSSSFKIDKELFFLMYRNIPTPIYVHDNDVYSHLTMDSKLEKVNIAS